MALAHPERKRIGMFILNVTGPLLRSLQIPITTPLPWADVLALHESTEPAAAPLPPPTVRSLIFSLRASASLGEWPVVEATAEAIAASWSRHPKNPNLFIQVGLCTL